MTLIEEGHKCKGSLCGRLRVLALRVFNSFFYLRHWSPRLAAIVSVRCVGATQLVSLANRAEMGAELPR